MKGMFSFGAEAAVSRATGDAYDIYNAQVREERKKLQLLKQHICLLTCISNLAQIPLRGSYDDTTTDINVVYRRIMSIWRTWEAEAVTGTSVVGHIQLKEEPYVEIVKSSIFLAERVVGHDQRPTTQQFQKLAAINDRLFNKIQLKNTECNKLESQLEARLAIHGKEMTALAHKFYAEIERWKKANIELALENTRLVDKIDQKSEEAQGGTLVEELGERPHKRLSASGALNTTIKL